MPAIEKSADQKIIFLDIDGVLASVRSDIGRRVHGPLHFEFDPVAIGMLDDLCKIHHAKIVIISGRAEGEGKVLHDKLRMQGFTGEFHDDWRIEDVDDRRGAAIDSWCQKHGVTAQNYVILDDKDDGYSVAQKSKNLIQTTMEEGMLKSHYDKADALLSNKRYVATGKEKQ